MKVDYDCEQKCLMHHVIGNFKRAYMGSGKSNRIVDPLKVVN